MARGRGRMTARLVESLYVEAMLLADEARGYFDEPGRADRDRLAPLDRVTFACESLKVTTRLMHVIAWLLHRKAEAAGEIDPAALRPDSGRLGHAATTETGVLAMMPATAAALIAASMALYDRVHRLERDDRPPPSPARTLIRRLENAF
ncbi:DUF1465 family protein [Sphingomonas flavalba]|uniref:DUF1465 family protein n=1 Tax=Sphingomonas flavalba TaxID=2559804 RepID=UPI0039E1CFEB